jgi:hypothetical protein
MGAGHAGAREHGAGELNNQNITANSFFFSIFKPAKTFYSLILFNCLIELSLYPVIFE